MSSISWREQAPLGPVRTHRRGRHPWANRNAWTGKTAKLAPRLLRDAAELIEAGVEETLSYYAFPSEHWRSLRTNNPLERLMS
jgi:transposase-like protein